jgi:hypothetical protein
MMITTLDKSIFDMSLKVNKWLYNPKHTSEAIASTCETEGVRLPKLKVPTFFRDSRFPLFCGCNYSPLADIVGAVLCGNS